MLATAKHANFARGKMRGSLLALQWQPGFEKSEVTEGGKRLWTEKRVECERRTRLAPRKRRAVEFEGRSASNLQSRLVPQESLVICLPALRFGLLPF